MTPTWIASGVVLLSLHAKSDGEWALVHGVPPSLVTHRSDFAASPETPCTRIWGWAWHLPPVCWWNSSSLQHSGRKAREAEQPRFQLPDILW